MNEIDPKIPCVVNRVLGNPFNWNDNSKSVTEPHVLVLPVSSCPTPVTADQMLPVLSLLCGPLNFLATTQECASEQTGFHH